MNEETNSNALTWISVGFVLILACLMAYLIVSDTKELDSENIRAGQAHEQIENHRRNSTSDAQINSEQVSSPDDTVWNQDALGVPAEYVNALPNEKEENRTFYFDALKVEEVLNHMSLDLDAGVVIDEQTRFALQYGMSLLPSGLTKEDLSELEDMISRVYPGVIGDEIASLVVAFYRLSEADAELDRSVSSARSNAETLDQIENIIELRERLLGQETAQRLFGDDLNDLMDAASFASTLDGGQLQAKYGSNIGSTDKDAEARRSGLELYLSGTDEEMKQSLLEIEEQVESIRSTGGDEREIYLLRADAFGEDAANAMKLSEDIANEWNSKYESYLVKKQIITEAGISEEDKQKQIVELLQSHYGAEEWLAAQAYDNEQNSRGGFNSQIAN